MGTTPCRYVVLTVSRPRFPDIRVVGGTGQASGWISCFSHARVAAAPTSDETSSIEVQITFDNNGVPRFHRLLTDSS